MLEFLSDRKTEKYAFDNFSIDEQFGISAIRCERSDCQKG